MWISTIIYVNVFFPQDSFLKHHNSFDFGLIEDLETQLSLAGTWIVEVELDGLKGPIQPKPFYDLHIPKKSHSYSDLPSYPINCHCAAGTKFTINITSKSVKFDSILQNPQQILNFPLPPASVQEHLNSESQFPPPSKKTTRFFWKGKIACWHLTAGQDFSLLFICSKSVI